MITTKRDLKGGTPLWADSPRNSVRHRTVLDHEFCDVAIVGAGVTGALIAANLTQLGLDVVVVDEREPARGGTLASTAMIQFEIDTPLTVLSGKIGSKKASRAYLSSLLAVHELKAFIARHKIRAEWKDRDALYLAGDELGWRGLKEETEQRQKIGLPSTFISGPDLMSTYGFDRTGAIISKGSAEVNPVQLTAACLKIAQGHGSRIYARQEVMDVIASNGGVRLLTAPGGEISARRAIFATGYEVVKGVPRDAFNIISTWAIATKPIRPAVFWPTRCLVWEASDPYLYMRSTSDDRILIGGEDSKSNNPKRRDAAIPNKAKKLRAAAKKLLPDLEIEIDYAWGGTFADSRTGLPYITGIDAFPNCLAVLGCGGNGITFGMVAATFAKRWVAGRSDPDADLFLGG